MDPRHAQKSSPSFRPRSARWKPWLCASTKPGSCNVSATGAKGYAPPAARHPAVNLSGMATRAVPAPLAQLPNALTVGRLLLIPVFVALMVKAGDSLSWPAGILFAVAGATDQIDGFLARRWRVESRFGKIADPLADRLLIDAAVILLVAYGRLPWAGLVVIGARDLLLLVGWQGLTPRGVDIDVNVLGKTATWLLYLGIGCRIVTHDHTSWPLWIFWIGLGGAVVAAMFYVRDAWKELHR